MLLRAERLFSFLVWINKVVHSLCWSWFGFKVSIFHFSHVLNEHGNIYIVSKFRANWTIRNVLFCTSFKTNQLKSRSFQIINPVSVIMGLYIQHFMWLHRADNMEAYPSDVNYTCTNEGHRYLLFYLPLHYIYHIFIHYKLFFI